MVDTLSTYFSNVDDKVCVTNVKISCHLDLQN